MSITPAEREIEKASDRAQESSLDGLLARGALRIEAPTGFPARTWTQAERDACQAALRRIIAAEEADPVGTTVWQLNQMHSALAFDRAVVLRAAQLLAEAKRQGFLCP